jgi:hypothetical protein
MQRPLAPRFYGWAKACGFAAVLACAPIARAQNAEQAVGNHLQAGEFGPAVALAQQQQGPVRDRLMGQIANAQARAGMRQAAFDTVGGIGNSRAFGQTLQGISGQGIGDPFGAAPRGGLGQPDFDSLIDLITNTVKPDSWRDAGGPGTVEPFQGGVRVDTAGLVHSLLTGDASGMLPGLRRKAAQIGSNADVRSKSLLRKVSLTRLERAVQLKLAKGEPLGEDMLAMAGLHKIQYVLVYPETGDIVLAGPAGNWRTDEEGRVVSTDADRPTLQLEGFLVILRHIFSEKERSFGCSIEPVRDNLAQTKAFLDKWAGKKIPAGASAKEKWLGELRDTLGRQAIEFYGIDPRTRVARVMFEADYRMKLVGIGKEKGLHTVPSYLSMLKADDAAATLGVLRWWFTLNYESILASADGDAFEVRGQGVKVLSENELVDAQGNRSHTGQSDEFTAAFAQNFTKAFKDLAAKYPIYAELQNICDLALVCSLMRNQDLPGKVGWQMNCFGSPGEYQVSLGNAPKMVESVINQRDLAKGRFVVVVSGGVRIDPTALTEKSALASDKQGTLDSRRGAAAPRDLPLTRWWWD